MTGFEREIEDLENRLKALERAVDEAVDDLWEIQLIQKRANRTRERLTGVRKRLLVALQMAKEGRS